MMLFIFEVMRIAVRMNKYTLVILTTVFLVSSSFIIHWIEPNMFKDAFIGFWYVMTTVTTTGYGDFVPETVLGKVFGLFLYFFGIGLIGIVIGKVVEGFGMYRKYKEEGKLRYKGSNHYVIIGWSDKARHTYNQLMEIEDNPDILLIDTLTSEPSEYGKLFYIQGDVTDKDTLERANIIESEAVLIFTENYVKDTTAADGKSLLIVSAIESYAKEKKKDIYTIVEILEEKHIINFKHANVDEFVVAGEALSDLMAKSAVHKGSSKLVMHLLSRKSGVDIWKLKKKASWETYNDAYEMLKQLGANLISDRHDFNILSKLDDPIPNDAELFIICNKETYERAMHA
ncbi:potassium channel family protein [Alteribacter populi]|uniref:potassium channel family protein n=1 Tax=Alteribacter populi TaxID=2011011 RepID=UPI000BBA510F|nr:potassium channel family protein [Alteribacter populi]